MRQKKAAAQEGGPSLSHPKVPDLDLDPGPNDFLCKYFNLCYFINGKKNCAYKLK